MCLCVCLWVSELAILSKIEFFFLTRSGRTSQYKISRQSDLVGGGGEFFYVGGRRTYRQTRPS